MSRAVQQRGGTTTHHSTFVGEARELTVDTTKNTVVVHDGATQGGIPLAKEAAITNLESTKVAKASIVNNLTTTDTAKVLSAAQGKVLKDAQDSIVTNKVAIADIIDVLTSTDTTKPLSAAQGKVLKDAIDALNTLVGSDDTNLDTLQEIVDFIKTNKSTLDTLSISGISGLQAALDTKLSITAANTAAEKYFKKEMTTIASSAAIAIDFNKTNSIFTLTANATITATNVAANIGSSGTIVIKQDATGGRTMSLPTIFKTPKGQTITQYTAANSLSMISYVIVDVNNILVNYIGDFK
jgi:hypothetical protein